MNKQIKMNKLRTMLLLPKVDWENIAIGAPVLWRLGMRHLGALSKLN
jgi:hypothetical protein